jgi:hypothetical protein
VKRRRPLGLHPTHYTAPKRWQVDYDYVDKLPPEAQRWLARFSRAHYDGTRSGLQPLDLQRDSDRARRRNDFDVLTTESVGGRVDCVHSRECSPAHARHSDIEESLLEQIHERRSAAKLQAVRRHKLDRGQQRKAS